MDDNSIMPFGKYEGEKLANIPASYLIWVSEQGWCKGELKAYIDDNMDSLIQEAKKR